jgi:hypothetical protein
MQDGVHRAVDGKLLSDIRLREVEPGVISVPGEVRGVSGQEGIEADHLPTLAQEPFTEVGSEEAGSAGDHGPWRPFRHAEVDPSGSA